MPDLDEITSNPDYIKIPLVGNKFCKKKPTKKDTNIQIIRDTHNEYDARALKVVSIREGLKHDLGFIIKEKIDYVNSIWNDMKFITIIKKIDNNNTYYYLIYRINNI